MAAIRTKTCYSVISSLYVCMVNMKLLWGHHVSLVSQSFRSVSSNLHGTDEGPSLRIESFAMINLRGVSTKSYFNVVQLLFKA